MKEDLRWAKEAVASLYERGQKEAYIDRCDLSDEDVKILKRVWVERQSRVKIAMEMRMDTRTVDRHYRRAMMVLAGVIAKK